MRKFASTILIITIMMGGLLTFESAQADTYVNGTIYANTTWTNANSPYTLTGNVIISNGVTLTIESGVTVNFGSYTLFVNGILNARAIDGNTTVFSGNGYSSIVFTSTSTDWSGTSGCIIDNAYFSLVSLVIEDSSPLISNNVFVFESVDCIRINSGSSPIISYNVIAGDGEYVGIYTEGTAYISNNNITECWTGINAVGASTIQYNNVMENENDGIRSENAASIIQNNVLANNNVGISVTGTIRDNTIANNLVAGIWGPDSLATITRNNIYDNTQNVHLTESYDIEAVDNWWGTTDVSAINQTIWDHKNASNLGILNFIPYLDAPNSLAPSIPPFITIPPLPTTPTPTSTPTATPTPFITPDPTPSITPTPPSPTMAPSPTVEPTETPHEYPDQFDISEILGIVVVVLAILVALIIIVFINRKYGKS